MYAATGTPEIAFIFGAGASMPPLVGQQGLVHDLLKDVNHSRLRPAQTYLRRAFPGLLTESGQKDIIRFEDIVGPLEIAESEEYWYHFAGRHRDGSSHLITNREVLDSLDTWVAIRLDPMNVPKPPGRKDPQYDLKREDFRNFYAPAEDAALAYSKLVFFLEKVGSLEKTVFLSMNYDILFDRVLWASEKYSPDYVIDAFYDIPGRSNAKAQQRIGVRLLKLHGSLNWRVCDRCHVLRNLQGFVAWPNSKCVDCGCDAARPMLIRPTLLKDFRHRVWRDVWREAGRALGSAPRWVIVGYSLPMADVWMLRLLAQSARSGSIGLRKRKITVVNDDANAGKRFALLFPQADLRTEQFGPWIQDCISRGKTL